MLTTTSTMLLSEMSCEWHETPRTGSHRHPKYLERVVQERHDTAPRSPYEVLHTPSKKEDDLKALYKYTISERVTASPLTAVCILKPKFRSINSCFLFVSFIFIQAYVHSIIYNSFSHSLNIFRLCTSIQHAKPTNQNGGFKSS